MMTSYNMGCSSRVVTVSLLYLVFVFCFPPVVWTQSEWLQKPENQMVPVGGTANFVCKSPNLSQNIVWTQGTNVLFVNGQRLSNTISTRYRLADNFTLQITQVSRSDDGMYGCNIVDFGSASAILTVLLPPGQPSITANLAGEIFQEGQNVRFTCASSGGNPAPTITWMKNGIELPNAEPTQTQSGGVTQRTIAVTMDYSDHRANYSCFVYNSVNEGQPLVVSKILAVQYAPIITFSPSSPYTVQLGQKAEFTCQVDANPAVYSVNWAKNGAAISGTSLTKTFNTVAQTDAGNYTCTASNPLSTNNPSKATIKVVVVYPPVVSVGSSERSVLEGSPLSIKCVADANPSPVETKWVKVLPDGTRTQIVNGETLLFSQIRKEDAGNYSCQARNYLNTQMASGEAFVYINVQYPPGAAVISPVEPINVGESLEIRCLAQPEGYPLAKFRWRKNNASQSQQDTTYTISQTMLSDNGLYICTPFNDVGEGIPAQVTISINEPPQLIEPLKEEISVRITDSNPLNITCKGQGRPRPTIEWLKDGAVDLTTLPQYYSVESIWAVKNIHSYEVTSTVYFRGSGREGTTGLRIEDMGNYTCRVKSLVHGNIIPSSTLRLLVQFKPVLPHTSGKVAVTLGDMAKLPCEAQSHPSPMFQWYRNRQQVESQDKYFIQSVSVNDTPSAYKSVLTIDSVKGEDYGNYNCFISNFLGNVSYAINVTRKSLPEAPTGLQTLNWTWESIQIKWEPGFDGGFPQQFQVYVQEADSTEAKFPPLQAGSDTSMNITGLWPSTTYEFSVVGRNELGIGQQSLTLTSYTRNLEIPTLGDAKPIFNTATNQLVIGAQPASQYCLKIDIKTEGQWETVKPCTKLLGGGSMEIQKPAVTAVNVSVCLVERPEVCGAPTAASVAQPDNTRTLTVTDVIIIACVCAVIIITLLIILICFICKRRRANAKEYYNSPGGHQPTANGGVPGMKPHPQQHQQSYDSPDGRPIAFVDSDPPSYWNLHSQHYGTRNDASFDSQQERQMFENELNTRNDMTLYGPADGYRGTQESISMYGRPQSPTKGKYIDLEDRKDPSVQSQESGYSTGDPNKPKKVIYEVVV